MKYELDRADGTVSRMTLLAETTPEAEIAKWEEAERTGPRAVLAIRKVDEFYIRTPVQPITFQNDAAVSSEVKDVIIGLAETISATRTESAASQDGLSARLAALEAEIASLKGVVR